MPPNHLKPAKPKPFGPILAQYRAQPITGRGWLKILVAGGLGVLAPLSYGLWRGRYASLHYGSTAAQTWGIPWYGLAALMLAVLIMLVVRRIRRAQGAVFIFKNGLGIQKNRKTRSAFRWGEISGISFESVENRFLGIVINHRRRLTVHPSIGKSIRIPGAIPDQDEISARIKARIYPRLLPQLRDSFKTGGNLYFGDVVINPQGIQLWGKKIRWDQVALINAREGFLVVELKNQLARKIPAGKIPNIELLLQIIQEGVDA